MQKRKVIFEDELYSSLKKGVNTLADAVKTTMGPKGKLVLIQRDQYHPTVTKDGVTQSHEPCMRVKVKWVLLKVMRKCFGG